MVGGGKDREEMRLIDADKLIDYFYYGEDDKPIIDGISDRKIINIIKNQPTTFDTEKVVEQLLDMRLIRVEQCHGDYEIEVMTESNFDDAIDIVKKGGVE